MGNFIIFFRKSVINRKPSCLSEITQFLLFTLFRDKEGIVPIL